MIPSILYIDDEPDNLLVFFSRLRKSFDVVTATSAEEGLSIISEREIQVVIADQRMPGISGIELLTVVRDSYPDIIRVILTAYSDSEDIIDAINRGAVHAFIKKPWVDEELRRMLHQFAVHYDLRRRSKELFETLYESIRRASGLVRRIPPELRAQVDEQQRILQEAAFEVDGGLMTSYLRKWGDSLKKINDVIEESESEYTALKAMSPVLGDDKKLFDGSRDYGLLDEDLVFCAMQFPERKATIHRLHFGSAEFRHLCQDYYECGKMMRELSCLPDNIHAAEYSLLKEALEAEIAVYIYESS